MISRARLAISLSAIAISGIAPAGCYRRVQIGDRLDLDAGPARDGAPFAIDSGPPPSDGGFVEPIGKCAEAAGVDLLFVIDDSASMAEEQASLVAQLPSLVRGLVEPPDDDGDGEPDWPAIPSLQIGVVTTDMGSGGYAVPGCDHGTFGARFGDDGILRRAGDGSIAGCAPSYSVPQAFALGGDDAAFVRDVSCVVSVGTEGCGFEQPLEAMLKAVSPSAPTSSTGPDYVPPVFLDSTFGHGDRGNAGLVRDDTLLAVIVVTDEEDCSVRDPEIFDPASTRYPAALDLRCFTYPEVAHPIERYVDGLLALRAERPDLLAFAVIAGVPPDIVAALPTTSDYEAMLAHPDMVARLDGSSPPRLVPSCEVAGVGRAYPPRRLVRTAMSIGPGRSTVQSICQSDLSAAIAPITRLVGRRACQVREGPPPM